MNRKEMIASIAEETGLKAKQVEAVIDGMVSRIHAAVYEGVEIAIHNLGKFSAKERAARTGHNPATGEAIEIPAKRVPHFAAAKSLKETVAG